MARSKKACLIFFDEIDAIGGARFDDGAGGDNEVQRTMLELINQLDGYVFFILNKLLFNHFTIYLQINFLQI